MPKTLFNFSIFTELSFGKYPTFFMLVGFTLGLLFAKLKIVSILSEPI